MALAGDDPTRRASMALAFVQHLPWRNEGTKEVYQSAVRSLKTGGNCHDLSVVLVALLYAMGQTDARITWVKQDGAPLEHVTVQVRTPKGWCYTETTIPGAQLCEDPYAAERRLDGDRSIRGDTSAPLPAGLRLPSPIGQDVVVAYDATKVRPPVAPNTPPSTQHSLVVPQTNPSGALNRCSSKEAAVSAARSLMDNAARLQSVDPRFALRAVGGRVLPDPTGYSIGVSCARWLELSFAERRAVLQNAARGWAVSQGIGPGSIDVGYLYDWINAEQIAMDNHCQAADAGYQRAVTELEACKSVMATIARANPRMAYGAARMIPSRNR
jgi:hypothetical protein